MMAAAMATQAGGRVERDAALLLLHQRQKDSSRRITVGADNARSKERKGTPLQPR